MYTGGVLISVVLWLICLVDHFSVVDVLCLCYTVIAYSINIVVASLIVVAV